jgi:hypothetical protein
MDERGLRMALAAVAGREGVPRPELVDGAGFHTLGELEAQLLGGRYGPPPDVGELRALTGEAGARFVIPGDSE